MFNHAIASVRLGSFFVTQNSSKSRSPYLNRGDIYITAEFGFPASNWGCAAFSVWAAWLLVPAQLMPFCELPRN